MTPAVAAFLAAHGVLLGVLIGIRVLRRVIGA